MSDVNRSTPNPGERLRLPRVDRDSDLLLHEQVAASIRRAIADGEAAPGERIPQARDLAHVLGVNTNTVLRAIRMLRDEGLLEAGRGKATTVASTAEQSSVIEHIQDLIRFGASRGYGRSELISIMTNLPR
jgi:GntR family transcriptional regulator